MSGLAERIMAEPLILPNRRPRQNHPKGFEPGVKFDTDSGLPESAVISSVSEIDATDHRAKIEEQTNLTIPAILDVRLERLTLQSAADGTVERYWYKYLFPLRSSLDAAAFDIDAFAKHLRRRKRVQPTYTGDATFVMNWNDWQIGKRVGGGTAGTIDRIEQGIDRAKARIKNMRRVGYDLGNLLVIGGGDMREGCNIFANQPWELDADLRTQDNICTDLILYGLDELAPLFETVNTLVVGGNHGENRQYGSKVNTHDNADCKVFEDAARVAARDDNLKHINFVIANDEPALTIDVHGFIVATTHGNVFGKSAGEPSVKAYRWYSGQAAGHLPAGDAHLLVTHHFHNHQYATWGACQWVQTSSPDGGSPFFTDGTGKWSDPGTTTWVMTPESRFAEPAVL